MSALFYACSVCFGDPNSLLTKGAQAGVLVMVGVVGAMLGAIVTVAVYWTRRARALQALEAAEKERAGSFRLRPS